MYIPEFWCGVAVTVTIEVAVIIGVAILSSLRKEKN